MHAGTDTDFSLALTGRDGFTATGGFGALERATAHLDAPFAVLSLPALRHNAADLQRRADGKPIRVASKSIRSRGMLRAVLSLPGFQGILAYALPEALWLSEEFDDVVVAYPSMDRTALARLAADARARERVTLMVDSADHLDRLVPFASATAPLRVCVDLDASLRLGPSVHLGMRRSPVHSPEEAVALARDIVRCPGLSLVGVMSYEGQIAGLGDDAGSFAHRAQIRALRALSGKELADRRADAVAAVRRALEEAGAPALEFVNGGGTGSFETTAREAAVTELAAGSGLYAPTLFDGYRAFKPQPAAVFALPVVRRPAPGLVTVLGGGWIASGPAGQDRVPVPVWPTGLRLLGTEGAGEVQTPLSGPAADTLSLGDRVWFRHAKAGELCEHVNTLHLVDGERLVASIPTYRGDGKAFLG
ncbi:MULTISPECIES: amino acid deaminase/aldolase [Arthrobacter]|uniref:Amino acid deaminase/aldolase n=2 Tax=Arthrobacter TaxID=1663 RepID=A0ABU9KHN0_9MICC|nr:amino acid deaminase/aldolase [Arthrobacter sp. YJM1]MDP5226651.1 amino acid deaminase/aldolase [Arthrobacter sp. YJM1]